MTDIISFAGKNLIMPVLLLFYVSVIFISFSGAMMPGPVTAIILSKSPSNKYTGAILTLGHMIVEVPLILLIGLGFASLLRNSLTHTIIGLLGGVMIIYMGWSLIRNRNEMGTTGMTKGKSIITSGIIASMNPSFFIWWATAGSALILKSLSYGMLAFAGFIVIHSLVDLIWHQTLSFTFYKTHHLLSDRVQNLMFTCCGLFLIGFGLYFIYGSL
jgi:threonine/homoserine/homoserine lactone efflux protein